VARPLGQMPSPPPPWKRWYKLARWQQLRLKVFLRDLYKCQAKDCGKHIADPVCDHIKPHRGDEALFWDEANLQTLCKPCHDRLKQHEEQASLQMRGVWH